jgi:hypothetical protein
MISIRRTGAWLYIWLCVRLGVLGFEWGEAVQCESEGGDPFEQPLEMRLVDDRSGDVGLTVMGVRLRPVERGGVAWSQFSGDDEVVAMLRHASFRWPRVAAVWPWGWRIIRVTE